MDSDSICAALMHDVLEDCNVQKSNLAKMFGDDVAHIVDGVSKLGKIDHKNIADKNANNLQKMALAMHWIPLLSYPKVVSKDFN